MAASLYLVNPRCDVPAYTGADVQAAQGFGRAVLLADVTLPTVAALAPPDFSVTLCEEAVSPVDFDTPAEFVGITGKISQQGRMIELAREFRRRGKTVIFGGCYASLSPDRLRAECDVLVRGELENIAEEFFGDLRGGHWRREYAGDRPDLRNSPVPRWGLYPNHRALTGTLQTSRGCPFECEFCDVIQYLGRKQRHKPAPQVLAELDELYRIGYRFVFLADDNFTVCRARTRELLEAIRGWNDQRTGGRVSFATQVSIDCTRDEELLKRCSDAGLVSVFVGVETPNAESLKETKKRQNIGLDMIARVGRLPAHGILPTGGMMVGFDADTTGIFERQYEFAMALPIPMFTVAPLMAPMATPLYARLQAENRLVDGGTESAAGLPWATNIVPKQMSSNELAAGMRWLCNRLYHPTAFEHRVASFIDLFEAPEPRRNSAVRHAAPKRPVDAEWIEVSRRVTWLGHEEAAMASRLEKRLLRKPAALPLVLLAMGYYMQVRHVYSTCGLWDPGLGARPQPSFQARGNL